MYRLSGQHSVERRQSSIENRLQSSAEKEQCCSEERLLSGHSNGQSSLSEIGQNEQLSDDRMHTPKPTRNVRKNTPPSEKWNKFMDEFRIAAEGVELKSRMYPTNPSIRDRKSGKIYQLQVHVLFTYTYTDGSRTAAVVELRNVEKLYSNHISIDRLCSARNALLENGCHKVYAYLYVKEGATVSGPLKIKAEVQDIKIVKKDEMSQTQLVLEIDETLQLAPDPKTKSGATKCLIDFKSLEDTDSASVPGKLL